MIKCGICGKELKLFAGHLKTHNITWKDYKLNYPNAKIMSEEVIAKQSKRMMGNTWQRNVPRSQKTRLKMSLTRKGKPTAPHKLVYTEKGREIHRKLMASKKYCLGRKHTEEEINNLRIKSKEIWSREDYRNNATLCARELWKKPDYRNKVSLGLKRAWKKPEYRNKIVPKIMLANNIRPTQPEIKMLALLGDILPNEYKYTGSGDLIIDGICPDFAHCNGMNKVIEVYGDYWHRGENPQDRIDKFREFGYDCIVIWEHEIKNSPEQVKDKIKTFHEKVCV